jgi:methyltransferase
MLVVGPLLVLVGVLLTMLVELRISRANERLYRAQGAVDAPDPVYGVMRWAYPGAFVLMALEGAITGRVVDAGAITGVIVFALAKAFKAWAIHTLGRRWTYRVLVLPDSPLVERGPYAFVRHPNYVGVIGELLGMALMMRARVSGPLALLAFGELLRRRIVAEERALGLRR